MTDARDDELALGLSGAQLQAVLGRVHDAILLLDADGVIRFAGGGVRRLAGWEPGALTGRSMLDFIHPDEHEHVQARLERWTGRPGMGMGPTLRVRTVTDEWVDARVESMTGPEVQPFAAAIVLNRAEGESPGSHEERLARIASAFVHLPPDRIEDGLRTALAEMGSLPGVDRVSLARVYPDEGEMRITAEWAAPDVPRYQERHGVVPLLDLPSIRALMALETIYVPRVDRLPDEWGVEREFWLSRGAKSTVAVPVLDGGTFVGFLAFESVRAEQAWEERYLATLRSGAGIIGQALARSAAELELAFQARHDPVTGLGNRWEFVERLEAAVGAIPDDRSAGVGVVVFDLDRFKVVNDSLGHAAGDELLAEVARRFDGWRDEQDCLARLGSDELVLLVSPSRGATSAEQVADLARGFQAVLTEPVLVEGHEAFVSVSAGVAFTTDRSSPPLDLLRDADAAMYAAKARGRNRVEVFDSALRQQTRHRLRREHDLRQAMQRGELEVHYQPEVVLDTGVIVGAEALLRWRHPLHGLLDAWEFIEIAEESGLILDLGAWVLRQACTQLGEWVRRFPEVPLVMRVNLSARQVGQPDLVHLVTDAVETSGVDAASLCLEITETTVMADAEVSLQVLEKLRNLGVELAIDDFGTGYSSLSHLKRLPVDVVKIDRSFVDGLGIDADDTAIVSAIVGLARTMGLRVTAEGVESPIQQGELLRLGCGRAQGFLLGRPLPAEEFTALLGRS